MSHNIVPTAASIAAESGGGTTNFLRADGTWAEPPSAGGGITALTGDVTASGSGSVAATIANSVVTTAKMGGDVTTAGKALLTAADAAAQRTALSLGTLATQSGTFSGTSSGTNTGDQTITLTGDVTGSGTGSFAATVANDSVTYAKMQNVSAASVLLGRGDSSAGDVQEITLGSGLSMTGTTLAATGGGGGDASFLFGAITDSTNSSNTVYVAVSGSNVTVEAGKTYWIKWLMRTWSAAATTAPRPRRILGGGAAGTVYGFHYTGQSNASAAMLQSSREGTNDPFLATGNATSSTTASGSLRCECLFTCTTGGTIGLEFLSEVNTSLVTISGDGSFWVATVRTT